MLWRFTLGVLVTCQLCQSIRSDEIIQMLRENEGNNSSTMRTPSLLLSEKEILDGFENNLSVEQVEPPTATGEKYTSESPQDTNSNIEAEETVARSLSETLDGQLVSIKTNNHSGVVTNALLKQSDQILLQNSESNKRVGDIGREISSNFKIQKNTPSDINSELESHFQFPALPSNLEISEDSDAGIQYIYSYHPDIKSKLKNSEQVDKKGVLKSNFGYNNANKEGKDEASHVLNAETRAHSISPLDSLKHTEETQKITIVKQKSMHSISREEKQESVNIQKNPEPRLSNDEDIIIPDHQAIQSDASLHSDVNQNEGTIVLLEESYIPDKNYGQEDDTFGFHSSSYNDQPHSQTAKQFIKPGETSNSANGIQYNNHGDGVSTQYFLTKHNSGLTNPLSDTDSSIGHSSIESKYTPQTQSDPSEGILDFPGKINDPSSDDHLLQTNHYPTDNEHGIVHQQEGDNVVLVHKVDPNQIYIDEKTGQLIKFVTEEESEDLFEGAPEGTEADILKQSHELLLKNFGEKNNPGHNSHNHFQQKGGASFDQNNGYEKQEKGGTNIQYHVGTVSGNSDAVGQLHTDDHETSKQQENGNSDSDNAVDYVVLCNGKGNVDYDQSHYQNDYGQKLQTLHNQKGSVQGHNFKGSNSGILQQHGSNKGTHFQMANGGLNYPINSNFEHGNFGSKLGNSNFKGQNNQVLISLDTDKPFKSNKLEFSSGKGTNNDEYTFVKGISDLDSQLLSGLNKGTHFANSGMHKQNNVHIEFSKPQNNFKGSISNLNSIHGQSSGPVIGKLQNHKNFKASVGNLHGIKGTTFPVINGGNGNGFSKGDNSYMHNTQGNFKGTSIIHEGPNLNSAQGSFKGHSFGNGGNNIYNPGQDIHNSLQFNSMSSLGVFQGQSVGHKLNGNQFQNNNVDLQLGLHPSFGGMMKNQYPPSLGGIVSNHHQPSFGGIVSNHHQSSFGSVMKNQHQPSFGGMIKNHQSQPHVEWILVEVDGNNHKNTGSMGDNNYYIQYDNQPKLSIPQSYMSYMSGIGGHSYSGNSGLSNTYQKPKIRYMVEGRRDRTFPTQMSTSGFQKGRSSLPHLHSQTPKGNINFGMELHKRSGPLKLPQFFIEKRSDVKSDEEV